MENIKFRVWDKDDEEMREVENIHVGGNRKQVAVWNEENDCCEWVYNYELMQYTGFKDMNGKEIYEGDILKDVLESKNGEKRIYYNEIFYSDGCFQVRDLDNSINFLFEYAHKGVVYMEVVGNVYENPELIKKRRRCEDVFKLWNE